MASKSEKRLKLLQDRMAAGLTDSERDFLQAAEIGDLDIIKNLIESETVSVNCVDAQGRTALESAVAMDDEDIVVYLLDRVNDKIVHKALLCACDNDRDKISEIILQHRLYQERPTQATHEFIWKKKKTAQKQGDVDSLLREALLRAAKRNNFQIVKQLMLMGAYLDQPHDYFCNCSDCNTQRSEDFKVYTNRRLDTYSAMASPAYISLTQEDPIMSAFKLSVAFKRMAEIEGEFKAIYNELANQVEEFTLALLDQCHSSDEVKAVLSGKPEPEDPADVDDDDDEENDILPMLSTAIRMEQKRFVAHEQCQAQIAELWYSGVPFLRYLNRFAYLMLAIPIGIVLVPIMSIVYLIAPWSRVTTLLDTPIMRFLSYTCSYLSFLVFVMVTKLELRGAFDSLACEANEAYTYGVIIVLFMWIWGLIWEECKQIYSAGAKDYFRSFWNVIDSSMLSMLLASFVLEIVTPLRLKQVISSSPKYNYSAAPLCQLILRDDHNLQHFCLHERKDALSVVWEPAWIPDPELLSDILFTFGTILSIGRFSFIMPANEALGTMLVSFHRVISDLLKLCGMFILVLIAFASGLSALYAPSMCRNENFGTYGSTISTLLWSMFGMGDTYAPESKNKQAPLASLMNNYHREDAVITVGYYLYAIYVFAAMIVLLNLLIAVMSNTFEEVQGVSDVEWKFSRTELWLTFIEPGCPIPPPFNVIPSPKSIAECFKSCCSSFSCKKKKPDPEPKIYKYAAVQENQSEPKPPRSYKEYGTMQGDRITILDDGFNSQTASSDFGSQGVLDDVMNAKHIFIRRDREPEPSELELSNLDQSLAKSETSLEAKAKTNDRGELYCVLIRRYTRDVERQRLTGEDAQHDASEDMLRKLIERVTSKIEKKIEELFGRLTTVESNVTNVQEGESDIVKIQHEHTAILEEESRRRSKESEKFLNQLNQAKLDLFSRMEAERRESSRIWEDHIREVIRKIDESRGRVAGRVAEIEALRAAEEATARREEQQRTHHHGRRHFPDE